jgi:hypothetical protein
VAKPRRRSSANNVDLHSRRYCHARSVVCYPQHRTLPRATEARLLAVLLRSICKTQTLQLPLPRPRFGRPGDTRRTCGSPRTRHIDCNDSAAKPSARRLVRILSDRNLAKGRAGTARSRPPTRDGKIKANDVCSALRAKKCCLHVGLAQGSGEFRAAATRCGGSAHVL